MNKYQELEYLIKFKSVIRYQDENCLEDKYAAVNEMAKIISEYDLYSIDDRDDYKETLEELMDIFLMTTDDLYELIQLSKYAKQFFGEE